MTQVDLHMLWARIVRECAADVCMYCGKRAVGYGPAVGPNPAGNWEHRLLESVMGRAVRFDPTKSVACIASPLWRRLRNEGPPQ